jgi:hypothetical protein
MMSAINGVIVGIEGVGHRRSNTLLAAAEGATGAPKVAAGAAVTLLSAPALCPVAVRSPRTAVRAVMAEALRWQEAAGAG